jgi:hypothetical protein
MPPGHTLPKFLVGDHVFISTSQLSSDSFDSKLPTRFVAPFVTVALQYSLVSELDFDSSFPMCIHFSADLINPSVWLPTCALRPGEDDSPLVGEASPTRGRRPIPQPVARAGVRGCPPFSGRRSCHYTIGFKAPDSHFDVWINEEDALHKAVTIDKGADSKQQTE